MSSNVNITDLSGYNFTNVTHHPTQETSFEEWDRQVREWLYPTTIGWLFVGIYCLVFAIGIIGNLLVCYAVWANTHLRTVTNYFLVNLACADFMVILVCLPLTLVHDIALSWLLGLAMCRIVNFLQVGYNF